ncbi:MAG: hypothetical protein DRP08_05985 [Candidatus Aenigmatarchaeota archaeon]|nr:MAG: hypothetical protein DRP08_05985 [Candidatus Aenigmarchaeota archaeon]
MVGVRIDHKELIEERRRNREDMLRHIDRVVKEIKKDHKKWLRMHAEWLRRSREAQLAILEKMGNRVKELLLG